MSRIIYFGNNLDIAFSRVGDKIALLRLSVLLLTGGKFRAALDLHAPALIIGQMKLKSIVLETRHQIDEAFQITYRQKKARRANHQRPEARAGRIGHLHAWQEPPRTRPTV